MKNLVTLSDRVFYILQESVLFHDLDPDLGRECHDLTLSRSFFAVDPATQSTWVLLQCHSDTTTSPHCAILCNVKHNKARRHIVDS